MKKSCRVFNTWKGVDTKEMFKIGVFSTTLGLCVFKVWQSELHTYRESSCELCLKLEDLSSFLDKYMVGREREGGRLKFCVVIVKLILSVEGKFHEHIGDFLFNSKKGCQKFWERKSYNNFKILSNNPHSKMLWHVLKYNIIFVGLFNPK